MSSIHFFTCLIGVKVSEIILFSYFFSPQKQDLKFCCLAHNHNFIDACVHILIMFFFSFFIFYTYWWLPELHKQKSVETCCFSVSVCIKKNDSLVPGSTFYKEYESYGTYKAYESYRTCHLWIHSYLLFIWCWDLSFKPWPIVLNISLFLQ